ncbi:thiamine pyrophosphate-dependent enzyme [Kutzneria sp. 744]|uniref:thiamine pyrophosphate-dependent enzyme n=1 Tax=Kutzneria sp. (strain 744) TaxID=345341 RepID=UPI0003EEBE19|nr:thiamine pyrophosphate-dependent enzyme [Kutzneria sp. 744]EWM13731.1 pyruvate dehydrogenase E1 component subunit alpha [Kutzneria sp. 744]
MPTDSLLPPVKPDSLIDEQGRRVDGARHAMPDEHRLRAAYRAMVVGRALDQQATRLAKQGELAVYPSARGQEACQVGAVLALGERDWLFPTYRDTMAVMARGVDPVEALTLMRGSWHCGYDPRRHRVAPQCTPLATHATHAVGFAHAARLRGEHAVAMVLLGDGATSEGDFHEALNFAGVFRAGVVFLVQNNHYAISVPLERQTAAPSLAHKGIGHGVPGERVDGNDVAVVLAVLDQAVERARVGDGPTLVEAITYRMEPHSNSDDETRYRDREEVDRWAAADPVDRLGVHLELSEVDGKEIDGEAAARAADLRDRMVVSVPPRPDELFAHVGAPMSARLARQLARVRSELAAEGL